MKRDEDGLLVRLGQSYVGARRLDDAVRTFRLLLDTQTETCRKNIAAVEYCADAQYYISFADMQSNHALGRHDGNAVTAAPAATFAVTDWPTQTQRVQSSELSATSTHIA